MEILQRTGAVGRNQTPRPSTDQPTDSATEEGTNDPEPDTTVPQGTRRSTRQQRLRRPIQSLLSALAHRSSLTRGVRKITKRGKVPQSTSDTSSPARRPSRTGQ